MFARSRTTWITALLVAGLALFATVGCSEDDDDDDNGPTADPAPTLITLPTGTIDLATSDPVIEWEALADAQEYQVQVAATDDFSGVGLIIDESFDGQGEDAQTRYTIQVNLLSFGQTYYWRVRALLDDDPDDTVEGSYTAWSDVYDFIPAAPDVTGYAAILEGAISSNMTLDNTSEPYLLRGGVFVKSGATLSINAGVTLHGENATDGMLVIERGGMIDAQGSAQAPILMTSDIAAAGQGARGQWGGLIINGYASLNTGSTAIGEGGTGEYGGSNDADNSGTLRYVIVAYAGREISPDNELNGIAFQGVGSGTTVEYVQVHMNKDDGIEFFGGTVNARYIYCSGIGDDSFDWTDGWRGKGQFWVAKQYGDDADQGFENDSNGDDNDATPFSNPTIFNFTLVGDQSQDESDYGMLVRAGAKGMYHNGVVINFNELGIDIDDDQTFSNANDGSMNITHTLFFNNTELASDDEDGFDEAAFISDAARSNYFVDANLTDAVNMAAPDFTPVAGGSADTLMAATPPSDGFFEAVDFIGGVSPNNNWLAGWTIAQ